MRSLRPLNRLPRRRPGKATTRGAVRKLRTTSSKSRAHVGERYENVAKWRLITPAMIHGMILGVMSITSSFFRRASKSP